MNKVLLNYLLKNYLKVVSIVFLVIYFFGIILNLFEEIEFFKNTSVGFVLPIILTSIYIPSMLIKLSPFIIFVSSMIFLSKIRNNKDLLVLKIFGYSNFKIFLTLAFTSFLIGWFLLFVLNPVTSFMAKYYEKTKSNYARDIGHLATFNKNGLWIKENYPNFQRIITAQKPEGTNLITVSIFNLDNNSNLISKINAEKADIKKKEWILHNVVFSKIENEVFISEEKENLIIYSKYNFEKINNLFKNFDTLSLIDIIMNKDSLSNRGYNMIFLNQNLHTMLTLPFLCFLMTAIGSILTLNTLKQSDGLKYVFVGLVTCILVFYFKDLFLALGQTNRMPLILSIWTPVLTLSFFIFIGVLQINEK